MTYYLFSQGEVSGPYTNDQVAALCQNGSVTRETQIREEGAAEWRPLYSVFPRFAGRVPMVPNGLSGVLITGIQIPFWNMVATLFRFVLAAAFISICVAAVGWLAIFFREFLLRS